MVNIRAQVEFQVRTGLHASCICLVVNLARDLSLTDVQQGMACERTGISCIITCLDSCYQSCLRIDIDLRIVNQTQLEEVLQQIDTILFARVVVDVNLAVALQLGTVVVNIQVVLLVIHHLLQVVVVGYTHGHIVRVCLAQVCLSIVGNVVAVLIPIERVANRRVVHAVGMVLGIALVGEQFPSAANHLVGSGRYVWRLYRYAISGQHNVGRIDIIDGGDAAPEVDMDVQHMILADGSDLRTGLVALLVVVLINHGDNLFLREVLDVAFVSDIQRTQLLGRSAVDTEAQLFVDERRVVILTND